MINVDGVVAGSAQRDHLGADYFGCWRHPNREHQAAAYYTKKLMRKLHLQVSLGYV